MFTYVSLHEASSLVFPFHETGSSMWLQHEIEQRVYPPLALPVYNTVPLLGNRSTAKPSCFLNMIRYAHRPTPYLDPYSSPL